MKLLDLFGHPRDLTKTPEFERWFGESKAVDHQGRPLIVYHGSTKRFKVFRQTPSFRRGDRSGLDSEGRAYEMTPQAFFFSGDKSSARTFAKDRVEIDKRLRNKPDSKPNVRAFYLSIQKPLDFIITQEVAAQMQKDGFSFHYNQNAPSPYAEEVIEKITGMTIQTWQDVQQALDDEMIVRRLKGIGYDGARLIEDDGSESWAVFEASQIKAVDNRGRFNPNSQNAFEDRA